MRDLGWSPSKIEAKNIPEEVIVGKTAAMHELVCTVRKLGPTGIPVLICGENGTGKEVVARLIHHYSRVRNGPFIKLNCDAMPGPLLETELFGHERDSRMGSANAKPSRVEAANGGTLFLDEIGDMDHSLQSKLLHLLQDGSYCRIEGREDLYAQIRAVCAMNIDTETPTEVQSAQRDFFYRIGIVTVFLPPLRERKADIPIIADYLLKNLSKRFETECKPLSESMLRRMSAYDWPGNIRELQNWVARYIILGFDDFLSQDLELRTTANSKLDKPVSPEAGSALEYQECDLKLSSRRAAQERERELIQSTLEANQWNRKRTAQQLHISYRALLYKMQNAGFISSRNSKKHSQ